jgi:Ca2+-transporting ATPase
MPSARTVPQHPHELLPVEREARELAVLAAEAVLARLGSTAAGLAEQEAAARWTRYGANVLQRPRRRRWYAQLAAQFVHRFAQLLWAASVLAWWAGMPELAWAIVGVIAVNGAFSFWQQHQAERAVEALEALLPRQVVVRRDGIERTIGAEGVVPGDIVVLEAGCAIPADARLIAAERLRVDMSSLTGESRPVPRTALPVRPNERTAIELGNLVLAGTTVLTGRAEAVVFATGGDTVFGRLATLTHQQPAVPGTLEREVARFSQAISWLALIVGAACFAAGVSWGGLTLPTAFLFAIGIIVANVPEGLLPTLTLALAIAVRRMARRQALVKRLAKVETLGATTVILTDKTGTLTRNEMAVRFVWVDGETHTWPAGNGSQPNQGAGQDERGEQAARNGQPWRDLLLTAALCCDAHLEPDGQTSGRRAVGDPTERALLLAAERAGMAETLGQSPRVAELPFDSSRKRMTTIHRRGEQLVACVKGAAGELLPHCSLIRTGGGELPLDTERRDAVMAAHDRLAGSGLRVLGVASRALEPQPSHGHWHAHEVERDLTFLGLVALADPPRPEVPAAVAACRRAGVRVIMVTGDAERTAAAIGREIGLYGEGLRLVSGREFEQLDDAALQRLLDEPELLVARAAPQHKLRLVEAFQARGEVVAVTGDGVNDAPALRRADIGVAMGRTGTDVAREAADMVLADDNFASIVAAIEEGRAVYDNVRKFVTYILGSNVPEIVPFVAFVLLGIPLPLTVLQILAVDLGTDLLPALALGAERPEADVMSRPPRSRHARLLDRPTLLRSYAWLGAWEAALGLAGYFFAYWHAGWRPGEPLADSGPLYRTATTMSLAGVVACQLGSGLACRSSRHSIFSLGWFTNRPLAWAMLAELALLAALIYVPVVARIFGLAPLQPAHWAVLAGFPFVVLGAEELRKAVCARWCGARQGAST